PSSFIWCFYAILRRSTSCCLNAAKVYTMQIWISQLFNGLSIGSILLLAALGLAFSFGLMKVINMAHGEFIMTGAYVTYFFQTFLAEPLRGADGQKEGIVFVLSIVAAFLITGALGLLLERFI